MAYSGNVVTTGVSNLINFISKHRHQKINEQLRPQRQVATGWVHHLYQCAVAALLGHELRDECDPLHMEAGNRRRMMSISTHDRIAGTPVRAKVLGEFLQYALQHPGVVFMRKDKIAELAHSLPDVPHK
ncbi:hypothetical protein H8L32_05715 [Undibacterium sp. CY18W]|uniref:Uncharacterized protein n=1 Tax=Undibacterium hunanense TaxID=2762292 RepID=A0ABR6ZM56_9BURK|nr:hypothetical protein [Undibacterium hunanense]MBC3916967.1 hypothetical protein [Undibacterium hunanense]